MRYPMRGRLGRRFCCASFRFRRGRDHPAVYCISSLSSLLLEYLMGNESGKRRNVPSTSLYSVRSCKSRSGCQTASSAERGYPSPYASRRSPFAATKDGIRSGALLERRCLLSIASRALSWRSWRRRWRELCRMM